MRHDPEPEPARRADDEDAALEEGAETSPDLLPPDAPRGAQTIPGASQTGTTTPPATGWGETLEGEEMQPEPPGDPRPR